MKTTISDKIMNEIANLTEKELKEKGVFYMRIGTKFSVRQSDINNLLDAQLNANKKLIKNGVITNEMLKNDIKNNL